MTVDAILQRVDELTPAERDEVISRLLDRYAPVEMTDELAALLDARAAEADANPGGGFTIDQVIANARRPR
jgi:putative addiction module component (TIGR02574 family)